MGFPMAGHLARAGMEVTVFNRSPDKAGRWLREFGAPHALAYTPADAAAGADIIFCCVGDDPDVRSVTLGDDGAFQSMHAGALFVDHTTTSAALAKALAEEAPDGVGFVDAPVSGGQAGAENAKLTIMAGGAADDVERARPVMSHYAARIGHMGPVGSGQITKMANQICIAGILQGLSEAMHFTLDNGLDPDKVVDVIKGGAAQSWQMENRAETMVRGNFDFGFAVEWMQKDLRIVLETAREAGISLPLTALVDQFYADVVANGGKRYDTSSLITRLRSQWIDE